MLLGKGAVAHGQQIQQAEGRQGVLHHGGAGHNAGVMAAPDLQLRILPADIINGMLFFIDARRGFEHRAEHKGHAVGDAAVHTAVFVGSSGDLAAAHRERVVGLTAAQGGKAEPRAELNALAGGNGKHQVGQLTLDTVKPRLADTGGQPGHNRLKNTAHAVALAARRADGSLHRLLLCRVQQGKMPGLRRGHHKARRTRKWGVLDACTLGNMGVDLYAQTVQHGLTDRARCHAGRRDAP